MTQHGSRSPELVVGCSSLAFSLQPLEKALESIAGMGFRYVDLGAVEGWAHVNPSEMAEGATEVASAVRELLDRLGLTAIAVNSGLGNVDKEERRRRFAGLVTFTKQIGAPVLTLPARGESMAAAVKEYTLFTSMARDAGIQLTVETHRGQLTEFPEHACELVDKVPGLGLTLDPAHYYAGPNDGEAFDIVYPYVRHVHVRDGARGRENIQVPMGEGDIDFGEIMSALAAQGYRGAFSVEYIDKIGSLDTVSEVQKARAVVEREWATRIGQAACQG